MRFQTSSSPVVAEIQKQLSECISLLDQLSLRPTVTSLIGKTEALTGYVIREIKSSPASLETNMILHDLKIPLNSAYGNLQLIELDPSSAESLKADLREQYIHVNTTALSLEHIDLQTKLMISSFSIKEFMNQVIVQTKMCEKGKAKLNLRECPQELVVLSDRLKLNRVLNNLIGNAIKYSQQDGIVDIAVRLIGLNLHFEITDHGQGMTEKTMEDLFKPYSTGEKAAGTQMESMGLGLYGSQQIIGLMGGSRIDVRSNLGAGSSFSFSIPVQISELSSTPGPTPSPTLPTPSPARPGLPMFVKPLTVCLAEDDKSTIRLYQNMIKRATKPDCKTVLTDAESGEILLKKPELKTCDVCVLDMHMVQGGLTGLQTAHEIHRLLTPGFLPPIIVVSGDDVTSEPLYLKLGDRVVQMMKPVSLPKLVAVINDMVTRFPRS
jgi:CheY-like chemotaxis protein/anti-sigma regulatory factor (Ser/Thr protein kinase)